jgi:hypothetical protein
MRQQNTTRLIIHLAVAIVVAVAGSAGSLSAQEPAGLEGTIEGVLTLIWGDGPPEAPQSIGPVPVIADSLGRMAELIVDEDQVAPLGGLLALNGRRVWVHGSWTSIPATTSSATVLAVSSIAVVDSEAPDAVAAVMGSQPWVSIMCKFADVSSEPRSLSYFQGMFSSSYPGLDHYWRELSYNNVNVVGSNAHGWYTLPHPKSHYVVGSSVDLTAMFNDCTAVADPDVYYPNYVGINLMFNDTFGCCAWGGSRYASLDGVYKGWRATWEPPWGYGNVTVMAHEMGHGFGLPHSCWDPAATYDNEWDVMSDAWAPSLSDPTYGQIGQHTVTHHKDTILGWLRVPEKVTVADGDSTTVVLERLALPTAPGPKMVKVPIGGSSTYFYTVEARKRAGYDLGLSGNAVIIHDVINGARPAAFVQGTDGGGGAMWTPGELFLDAANGIGIAVTGSVGDGFEVAVGNDSPMAASWPALDAHSGAGTSSNVNGVFEPGESVLFEPSWTTVTTSTLSPFGTLSGFSGPGGATYTLNDASGAYGSAPPAATTSCTDTGNCYRLTVSDPASRPALHWDVTVTEGLGVGSTKTWTLHLGSSFDDVAIGHWAYPHIETLLHSGITAGCSSNLFCPGAAITRWQMAPFLAKGLTGGSLPTGGTVEGRGSYNCVAGGTSVFSDVSPGNAACKAIHFIASRGITSGCTGSAYCPGNTVSRWQMAVFLAKSMAGTGVPVSGSVPGKGSYNCVAGGSSVFSDVPAGEPGCKAIHFIAAQGVTSGCGGTLYCPSNNVTRDQMAVFMTRAFGLALYSP